MLWIKAFHIVFVVSWFSGLFYLPRIYVNLAQVAPGASAERARLVRMARKLYRFMTMLGVVAVILGLTLWLGWGIGRGQGWMHAKLAVVVLVIVYHGWCGHMLKRFAAGLPTPGERALRMLNELPVLLLLAAVVLVVVKPF